MRCDASRRSVLLKLSTAWRKPEEKTSCKDCKMVKNRLAVQCTVVGFWDTALCRVFREILEVLEGEVFRRLIQG